MSINKPKMIAVFVAVLMFSSTLSIIMGLSANAQTTLAQPTAGPLPAGVSSNQTDVSAHLSFRPSPVGVGQTVLVNFWTSPAPGANRNHPEYDVIITKPDGTSETKKMKSYVADGTCWFEFSPDVIGKWTLQFVFPGTYFPAGTYLEGTRTSNATTGGGGFFSGPAAYAQSAYYKPDTTPVQMLTVQQDMVWSWPVVPLPTDYWTRPVPFEMREWWPILGNWPWWGPSGVPTEYWDTIYPSTTPVYNPRAQFTPWVQGPESAHVVWKQQLAFEGIVGGDQGVGSLGYELSGYGGKPSVILFGRAFQTATRVSPTSQGSTTYWRSYDIRTGQVYWERPLYAGESAPNLIEYGTVSYSGSGVIGADITPGQPNLLSISGGFLRKYNPYTGVMTSNTSISPLSSATYYMNGYCLSVQNLGTSGSPNYRLINWTTQGTSSIASRVSGNTSYAMGSLPSIIDYASGYGAAVSDVADGTGSYTKMRVIGYDLYTGRVTFNTTIDEPQYSGSANIADHGKVAVLSAKGYYVAFDLATGNRAWTGESMAYPWDSSGFGTYGVQSAYGMLYREAYSYIYAFDWNTGKIKWKFTDPALFPFEGPYINDNGTTVYPFDATSIIADGKMYVYNAEHTPYTPYTRGWGTFCINATTGEKIWSVMIPGSSWFSGSDLAVSDGYLSLGGADGYQYYFGRGLSATTVTASPKTTSQGSEVLIEGTVMDLSPAQPNTPCVSADSMATQMEHIHRQFPITGWWNNITITGVQVSLTAIDESGAVTDLGTVTTNGYYGTFSKAWAPAKEGTYTIVASFAADDSYGSSDAATAITIGPAPEAPAQQPTVELPDYSMLFYGMIAAIAIAILIGVVNLIVYTRRQK